MRAALRRDNALREQGGVGTHDSEFRIHFKHTRRALQAVTEAIMRRIWIAEYSLESSRQSHASAGRQISEIICCIGLVLLRIRGVRL